MMDRGRQADLASELIIGCWSQEEVPECGGVKNLGKDELQISLGQWLRSVTSLSGCLPSRSGSQVDWAKVRSERLRPGNF
jgi:hypothetical protein